MPPINEKKVTFFEKNLRFIYSITLIAIMGVAILTPAFPKIQQHFSINESQVGMLITVFTLPGIFLTLFLGILADRLGRKTILVPSLFLFGAAGFACAFTNDYSVLLILRFLQGTGAASLGSLNVTLIGDLYAGKNRASAMGYNTSVLSIGTASYPAIGGALASIEWYFPFLLAVLAIPVGLWILRSFPRITTRNNQNLKEYIKNASKTIQNRNVIILFLATVLTFIILYGSLLTYFPFLASNKFGAGTFTIGILMSTMSLSTAITSSRAGRFVEFISIKILFLVAFALYALACFIMPFISSLWWLTIPVIIFGIAQGVNLPNVLNTLSELAPQEYRAAFMSLNGMILRLGQTLGPAIMGLIYGTFKLEGVYYAGAGIAIIMIFMFLIFLDKNPKRQ